MELNNTVFNNIQTQAPPPNVVQNQNTNLISQTQTDEFVSQTKNQPKETEQKKSLIKKLLIAGAAIGGIAATIVFLYRKSKTTSVQHLANVIEFKKANTVEEGIEYGKKTFGIQEYTGFEEKDIDVLNWINEGFANVSNIMHGNLRMPKKVAYSERANKTALAGVIPYTHKDEDLQGYFTVNKGIFSDIDASLRDLIQNCVEKTKSLARLENGSYKAGSKPLETKNATEMIKEIEAFEAGSMTSFCDKVALYNTLRQYNKLPVLISQSPFMRIRSVAQFLEQRGVQTNINLEDVKNKTISEQRKIFNNLVELFNKTTGHGLKYAVPKCGPFSTIYHEMGHLQDMVRRTMPTGKFDSPDKYPEELKKWLDNTLDIQTANSVSPYAATGPGEFIAEAFSRIIEGRKVSDDVMQLYNKLNGPKIPA